MTDPGTYQIRVEGWIGKRWTRHFEGMSIKLEELEDNILATTFTGPLPDQAALRGLLNHLWDLNLTLISVTQLSALDGAKGDTDDS